MQILRKRPSGGTTGRSVAGGTGSRGVGNLRLLRSRGSKKKKTQRDVCIAQLGEMLHGKHPEIEELLVSAIDALQERKFEKITINTGFSKTIRMRMTKDGIKIEIERKMKEENLA